MSARRRSCRAIAPRPAVRRPQNQSAKPPLSPVSQPMNAQLGTYALCTYALGSGERCAPPAASRCSRAARVRAPSRGDPPHDGRFAQHVSPAMAEPVGCRALSSKYLHAKLLCGGNAHGHHPLTSADSTYAGGRRGKERAASLRAQQRLAGGGAQRSPDPAAL